MASFLQYLTLTLPKLTQKIVPTHLDSDPAWKAIRASRKVNLTGGSKIRIRIVKDFATEATEINDSNITVPLDYNANIFDYVEGDWPKFIIPCVFPHQDMERLTDAGEVKRYVAATQNANLSRAFRQMRHRFYHGTALGAKKSAYHGLMTLFDGTSIVGSRTGFENGLLAFQTPTDQQTGARTWLTRSRRVDSTNGFDNWYSQFKQHSGIGTDFFDTALEVKTLADSFKGDGADGSDVEDGEIDMGIVSITDHIKLGRELRNTPSGGSAVLYTVADVTSGRALPRVVVQDGIKYFAPRLFDPTILGKTEPAYLLPSKLLEFWVNKGQDFKMTKPYDGLAVSNIDADVSFCIAQLQLAPAEAAPPMRFGCISQ